MSNRGFTLIETMIAVVLVGVMAGFAFPLIGGGLDRQGVRSARVAITTMHAKARATAIQRARSVNLESNGNQLLLVSRHPVTGALDTLDRQNLFDRYGVTLTSSRGSLVFDPRGLGTEGSSTIIALSRGAYADTVQVTPVGSIVR